VTEAEEQPVDRPSVTRRGVIVAGVVVVAAAAIVAMSATGASSDQSGDESGDTVSSAPTSVATSSIDTDRVPTTSSSALPATSVRQGTTTEVTTSSVTADPPPEPAATAPPQDAEAPSVIARPVPQEQPSETVPPAPPPPWAATRFATSAGFVSTDLGCASGLDATSIDLFLSERRGPVMGWDYQHIYPLGGGRHLWLFQDTFVDQSGAATTLGQASFVHNTAMIQDGRCFRLLHRGTPQQPKAFEPGTGSQTLATWFWPMGGELVDGELHVFWVKMVKDAVDPRPPDGLGWHPTQTWLATYDPVTFARRSFQPAGNSGVRPVFGYAVQSDATHTYLFGNTFEQNLTREGGYWNGPHSATRIYLARVPRGRWLAPMEYRTADGWSGDAAAAVPIAQRHWAEFPMQPRLVDGQWVAATAVNGYWGDEFELDVANDPWGPWTTVRSGPLLPRWFDPLRNTYHAHVAPWRDGAGNLVVTVSNNARNMLRDAWPNPSMYRPTAFAAPWVTPPPPVTTTTTVAPATTAPPSTTTTSTITTIPPPIPPTSTTTIPPASTTTIPPTTSASTTSTTSAPAPTTLPLPSSTSSTSTPPSTTSTAIVESTVAVN